MPIENKIVSQEFVFYIKLHLLLTKSNFHINTKIKITNTLGSTYFLTEIFYYLLNHFNNIIPMRYNTFKGFYVGNITR